MAAPDLNKDFYVELDVGNLCISNIVQLKSSVGRDLSEDVLNHVAAHGAQQLLNEIFKLPCEYHEHVPVAKLPEATTVLPREKHVPKEKCLTKWEKFAKSKGINRRKKQKLVWDRSSKDWKAQYGYRGINNKSDWVVEVPENADPNIDYFAKKKEAKKERVAKNEYQRLRNIAPTVKMKAVNLESVDRANKHQLSQSLSAAKTATASVGRFTDRLPKEKPPKNSMKKRQFKPNIPRNMKEERENNLKIFQDLDKKNPKLNVQEAVQRYMTKPLKEGQTDEQKESAQKRHKSKKNKFVKNLFREGKKRKNFKRSS